MLVASYWQVAAPLPASGLHSRTDEEEGQEQKAVSHGLLIFGHIAALNKISSVKKSRENRHWWTCSVVCRGHFAEKDDRA